MQWLFSLARQHAKYLMLAPLFLLAVAGSTYVTERAINRYYLGRDSRLLASAAEQIEVHYRSLARTALGPAADSARTDNRGVCSGSNAPSSRPDENKKLPPPIHEVLTDHVRILILRSLFTSVMITEGEGKTLAQEPMAGLRIADASALLVSQETLVVRPDTKATGSNFTTLSKASNVRKVQFAGQDYLMFVQPLKLFEGEQWTPKNCVLVGLLPSRSLWSAPLEFTRRTWVVALLGTLVVLVMLPLLQLWFAKSGAGLRPFEVFKFVFSILSLASIATFAVLYLAFQHQRALNVDHRLQRIAHEVRVEASKELRRALEQLQAFDQGVNLSGWDEPAMTGSKYATYDAATWVDTSPGADTYGCQLIQYVGKRVGFPQDLSDREYFKQLHQPGYWKVRWEDTKSIAEPDSGIFIESIRSRASGAPTAALSIRSKAAKPAIAVLSIPFEAVMQPVMPEDYGFAIVDEAGKVHFHSDPSRGAGENILIEAGNDRTLYSSIIRRTEKTFSVYYQGSPHRFLVSRFLEGAPWTLIVFQDLSQGRRLQLETLLNSLLLFFAYAGGLMAVTAILYRGRYVYHKRKLGSWRDVAEDWAEDWLMSFHKRTVLRNALLAATYVVCLLLIYRILYTLDGASVLIWLFGIQLVTAVVAWIPRERTEAEIKRKPKVQDQRVIPGLALAMLGATLAVYGALSGHTREFVGFGIVFGFMALLFFKSEPERVTVKPRSLTAKLSYLIPATMLCVLTAMGSCFCIMVVAARHSEQGELRTAQLAFSYAYDRALYTSDRVNREGIYNNALFDVPLTDLSPAKETSGQPMSSETAWEPGWDFWGVFTHLTLTSTRNLQSSLNLHIDKTHDGSWRWRSEPEAEGDSGKVIFERSYKLQSPDSANKVRDFRISSPFPKKLTLSPTSPTDSSQSWLPSKYWLLLLSIAGLLPWLLHATLRRCTMTGVRTICSEDYVRATSQPDPTDNTLVLKPAGFRGATVEDPQWFPIDSSGFASETEVLRFRRRIGAQSHVIFENLQSCLSNQQVAEAMLDWLEGLTATRQCVVVIASTVHPLHFFETNQGPEGAVVGGYPAEYLNRWKAVMQTFVTEYTSADTGNLDAAEARTAWLDCSSLEREVLRHIARYSLTHPNNKDTVAELLRRHLLSRHPVTQLLRVHPFLARYAQGKAEGRAALLTGASSSHKSSGLLHIASAAAVIVPLALFAFEQDLATKFTTLLTGIIGIPLTLNRWLSSDAARPKKPTEVS